MITQRKIISLLVFFLFLSTSLAQGAEEDGWTLSAYQERLWEEGLERVIVSFRGSVNKSLISKHGGEVIRVFKTIPALVCTIPEENIEALEKERFVTDVSLDGVCEANSFGPRYRDPYEEGIISRRKEALLRSAKDAYNDSIKEAREAYLKVLDETLSPIRERLTRYIRMLSYLRRRGLEGHRVYTSIQSSYRESLSQYYAAYREARRAYEDTLKDERIRLTAAEDDAREQAEEIEIYSDGAKVEWNNREKGVNSIAAWNRYNTMGEGVTVIYLDTAINYKLPDLAPGYKGGTDFVEEDGDPFTDNPDDYHGTEMVSCGVGSGASKVIGVAPRASYKLGRVLGSDCKGYVSDFIAGVEWAQGEDDCDIINMSLGYEGYITPIVRDEYEAVCDSAFNKGILLVTIFGRDIPAGYDSVIVAGMHREGDSGWATEGDARAPGLHVPVLDPANNAWYDTGYSISSSHVSGMLALLLSKAEITGFTKLNNAYFWAVMTNSLIEEGGRIYAARSLDGTGPLGTLDFMAQNWPFNTNFQYRDYAGMTPEAIPIYYAGDNMIQDITIENNTGFLDSPAPIMNLFMNAKQYFHDTTQPLPGTYTKPYGYYYIDPDNQEVISNTYYISPTMDPGLFQTDLDFNFRIQKCTHNIKAEIRQASVWCPPGPRPGTNTGYGVRPPRRR